MCSSDLARSTKNIGGTKKSSSQLKSIPVDRVIFDELDEMRSEERRVGKECRSRGSPEH